MSTPPLSYAGAVKAEPDALSKSWYTCDGEAQAGSDQDWVEVAGPKDVNLRNRDSATEWLNDISSQLDTLSTVFTVQEQRARANQGYTFQITTGTSSRKLESAVNDALLQTRQSDEYAVSIQAGDPSSIETPRGSRIVYIHTLKLSRIL